MIWSISLFPIQVALVIWLFKSKVQALQCISFLDFNAGKSMLLCPVIMVVPFHVDFTIGSTEYSFSIHSVFMLFSELGW